MMGHWGAVRIRNRGSGSGMAGRSVKRSIGQWGDGALPHRDLATCRSEAGGKGERMADSGKRLAKHWQLKADD